jgi:hypothetical protein
MLTKIRFFFSWGFTAGGVKRKIHRKKALVIIRNGRKKRGKTSVS